MVLCFRLHFAKDATIGNTAGATVRQLVSLVFERVLNENGSSEENTPIADSSCLDASSGSESKLTNTSPILSKSLQPFALDAFMLFQVTHNF